MARGMVIKNKECLMGGCAEWGGARLNEAEEVFNGCEMCGFNPKEVSRRKRLPFRLGDDGKFRKVITEYEEDES